MASEEVGEVLPELSDDENEESAHKTGQEGLVVVSLTFTSNTPVIDYEINVKDYEINGNSVFSL